jgi:hypothetical protein
VADADSNPWRQGVVLVIHTAQGESNKLTAAAVQPGLYRIIIVYLCAYT